MVDYYRFRPIETDQGTRWIDLAQPWLQPMRYPASFLTSEEMMSDHDREGIRLAQLTTAGVFCAWQLAKNDPAMQKQLGVDPGEKSPSPAFIETMVPKLAGQFELRNYVEPFTGRLECLQVDDLRRQ